ncbi:hypothetical protein MLD38_007239 [Melastoma candidum]|uniref:Uncharacterized protein n=1 Tax=Melastoma candidum TaxID=119954 RepID=A0ACB9RSD9_9MYRT|nr:hypothetical protein MLD38_007239 [Melastoma candidum]
MMAESAEPLPSTSHPAPPPPPPKDSAPVTSSFPSFPNGGCPAFPMPYAGLAPGSTWQNQEHPNGGAGIYAVPVVPSMGPYGIHSTSLIPLTYNVPTRRSPEADARGDALGQAGQQQPQQNPLQQPGPQRPVIVRRFQIAIQLDLLLILKLAAVIFLFNQDGSRQRTLVLLLFATFVYLYQTGALTPLVRWLSQGMQRAAAPPNPPRPAVRANNAPPAGGLDNVNDPLAAEGQPDADNQNQAAGDNGNGEGENEHAADDVGHGNGANRWWGIMKEIQMIVFGFISSLLPGFHNID